MRKSKFTDSQVMDAVKRAEAGIAVPDICRELGISTATFYKWRAKYGGMDVSMMARMKELEEENQRSKIVVWCTRTEPLSPKKAPTISGRGFLTWWPGTESNHRHADFQSRLVQIFNPEVSRKLTNFFTWAKPPIRRRA